MNLSDKTNLILSQANSSHCEVTFEWAVNPKVRQFSFSQDEIKRDEHNAWFTRKLNDPNCLYLIGAANDRPFGSIRFDIVDSEAVISFLVHPDLHGKGLGAWLIREGTQYLKSHWKGAPVSLIAGYVMPNNVASTRTFEKLDFEKQNFPDRIRYYKNIGE